MKLKILTALTALTSVLTASAEIPAGFYSGALEYMPGSSLNLVFNLIGQGDATSATMDSPDQGAFGIPATVKVTTDDDITLSVATIGMTYTGKYSDGVITGTFQQGMMSAPLNLKIAEKPQRPQTPQPPFPYTEEEVEVEVPADGAVLSGTLTIPDNADSSTPVVVMVTGSGNQNRDEELFDHRPFAVIADYLARNGVASLRYDDRGTAKSTGDLTTATTATFTGDAAAVVDYVRNMGRFAKTGILGHSEGAMIAFRLGADNNADFIIGVGTPALRGDTILACQSCREIAKAGVPSPVVDDYREAFLGMWRHIAGSGVESASTYVDSITATWQNTPITMSLAANLKAVANNINPWLSYFATTSPAPWIARVKVPALALYGTKDLQVAPELHIPALKSLNSSVEIVELPGLNHMMQHAGSGEIAEYQRIDETFAPEALEAILTFINSVR